MGVTMKNINQKTYSKKQELIMNRFNKFISSRNKISLILSMIIMTCYYIFIFTVGAFPKTLGYKIADSSITIGILMGLIIIMLCIISTGIYTYIANKYFDKEQNLILKEMEESGLIQKQGEKI